MRRKSCFRSCLCWEWPCWSRPRLRAGSVSDAAGRQAARRRAARSGQRLEHDFEFSDPGLAYDTLSWSMLYTTAMLLMNYPEKNGQAGGQLYPEAATAFPTVSKDGKTYTFHVRPGLKFSDGSPVTRGRRASARGSGS